FDNVTADITVYAKWEEVAVDPDPDTYKVTITGDADETTDYTIAGADDLLALEGEVTLTITAVTDIRVNGSKVAEGSAKEIVVNKATTIIIDKYTASSGGGGSSSSSTITTYTIKTSSGKGGIIDADKTVSVRSGRNVEFEIKADEGYEIEDVKVDGKSVGAVSSYEFKRVRADHTISATFKKIEVIEPEEDKKDDFIDVPADEWYYDPIMKATDKGWFSGTSETLFSPNVAMSRGMIVTVLWRMENEPVSNVNSFADIMANNYYTTAVNWASEKGIVTGYGNDLFGPNDSITREQMASILYRYAQYKGYDTTQGGMAIREFLDYEDISEYALPPLAWGVNTGLMQGANNKLMPKDSATRAQVATILVRFSETIVK
ncbi:MAG: S-layer homology domain-containing protein, partial [Tissierellia bacterium]|nr:S-layer homology domain-containing protein [Tissierellia bacterium]